MSTIHARYKLVANTGDRPWFYYRPFVLLRFDRMRPTWWGLGEPVEMWTALFDVNDPSEAPGCIKEDLVSLAQRAITKHKQKTQAETTFNASISWSPEGIGEPVVEPVAWSPPYKT